MGTKTERKSASLAAGAQGRSWEMEATLTRVLVVADEAAEVTP
jgi:hypothetical protein